MLKPRRGDTRTFAIFAMSAGKRDISTNRRLFLIDVDDTAAKDADAFLKMQKQRRYWRYPLLP